MKNIIYMFHINHYYTKNQATPSDNIMDTKQTKQTKPIKEKKKRSHAPSAYNLFIKAHYDSVRSIKSPQDRMRELGKLWRAHKKKKGAPTPTAKK